MKRAKRVPKGLPAKATVRSRRGPEDRYFLEIQLPGTPPSGNVALRMNQRAAGYANQKAWKDRIRTMAINHEPVTPLVKAKITITRISERPLDFDGMVISFKPVIDGLCTLYSKPPKGVKLTQKQKDDMRKIIWGGVIINDSWPVTGAWNVEQYKCQYGSECIRVVVEEDYV